MPNSSPRPKILHVDGDTTAAKTLTAILRVFGYEAAHVYTAAEALVWCRLSWPDVVIADLEKQSMDGIQLAGQIVSGQPNCKVLFLADPLTASSLLRDSTMGNHNFPIFAKPVDPQKILDFLASLGAEDGNSSTLDHDGVREDGIARR